MDILCSCCTNLHHVTEFLKQPLPLDVPLHQLNFDIMAEPRFKTCSSCRLRMARTRQVKAYGSPNTSPTTVHYPDGPIPPNLQCGTCRKMLPSNLFINDSPRRPFFKCCEPCRLARRRARQQRRKRLGGSIDSSRMSSEFGGEEESYLDGYQPQLQQQQTLLLPTPSQQYQLQQTQAPMVKSEYLSNATPVKSVENREVLKFWPVGSMIRHYAEFCIDQHEKGYRWTPSFEETWTHVRNSADAFFPHWFKGHHSDERYYDWTPDAKCIEAMFEGENMERLRSGKHRLEPFGPVIVD